jgi:hypothetical protein
LSDTDPSHRLTEVFGYNGFALAFGGLDREIPKPPGRGESGGARYAERAR